MKLWVDEDLTPSIVAVAPEFGFVGDCNRNRGMLGRPDPELASLVAGEGFVFVTDNRDDYVELYDIPDTVHPGLVFIPGGGTKQMQQDRARRVVVWILARAAAEGESAEHWMVNKLVEMDRANEKVHAEWLPDEEHP